jgi:hypothetical protein
MNKALFFIHYENKKFKQWCSIFSPISTKISVPGMFESGYHNDDSCYIHSAGQSIEITNRLSITIG